MDKEKGFNNNDFFEIVRGIGGDLVEQVGRVTDTDPTLHTIHKRPVSAPG